MNNRIERTNWLAVAVLFTAGLVAAMQFAKVSPVMADVAAELQLSPVLAGLAVSILGLVGVLFAIAVGAMVNAIGLARALVGALLGGGVVAILGAIAPTPSMFLLSRFCEGFAHLFIVVSAPALMAAAAVPKDKPLALAIWGCFFGFGFAIASVLAPGIVSAFGWRGLLVAHGFAMLAVGGAAFFVLRNLAAGKPMGAKPSLSSIIASHLAMIRSGAPLLLALTFCAYTILFLAVLTFLTPFLEQVTSWQPAAIGSFLAFASALTLAFTLMAGFLVRWGVGISAGFTMAFLGLAVSAAFMFVVQPTGLLLPAATLVMMACFGLLPGFAFANVPLIANTPARATLTYGAIALFGNVGTFLGTPIIAASHQAMGWRGAAIFVVVTCLVGIFLAFALARSIVQRPGASIEN